MKKRLICILSISMIMLSIGTPYISNAQKNDSISITDARGKTITFNSPPKRIVSFMASNTEILFHLGLGDRVVGVDKYSNYPPEVNEVPKVGDAYNVDYEKIVSLNPDVVLITKANTNMISSLKEYDLKVFVTGGNTIDDVYTDIELVGKMCGINEKAERIVDDLKSTMNTITSDTRDLKKSKRPNTFYISGTYQGIYTPGNDTFQNTLIQKAGCNNIASDKEGWTTISEEEIIGDNPEIIIAPNYLKNSVNDLAKKESWQSIKAVKEDQIFFVNGDMMSRPGPRITEAQLRLVNINKVIKNEADRPDLKIKDIIIAPSNLITNGTTSKLSVKVENMGQMDAVNVKLSFWYSSQDSQNKTLINSTMINVIESKSTKTTEKFRWNYPETGNYTITAEVDTTNDTYEINEENNDLTSDVIVKESSEKDSNIPSFSISLCLGIMFFISIIKFKKNKT